MSVMLSIWMAPDLNPVYQKLLVSWNLVNPILSMNEAKMDECAARLQPLVDINTKLSQ